MMNNIAYFDNIAAAKRMAWILLSVLLVNLFCLLMCILLKIDKKSPYIILITLFALLVLQLERLRYFKLKVTEEQISVKYHHLILKRYKSTGFELPWSKIQFCKLERNIFSYYLCIGVSSRRSNKVFYYNLVALSRSKLHAIEDSLASVRYKVIKK